MYEIEIERVRMHVKGLTTFTNKTLNPDALAYLNRAVDFLWRYFSPPHFLLVAIVTEFSLIQ